jgi:hypothetical protein
MGNFNPDKILTRAEATALIMRAKGLESAAAGAAGATQFDDVPATHWASGYINLAAQSKVVNGYGDGNFGPEDEVKYEQFVKMVVAALDYEPKANLYGGYPSGYLIIASQKDITKSVPGTAGQPIPRKTVAQILFNALDVGMMELTLDNKGTVQYHDGDDTLLKTYLYINQYEGVLTDVAYNTDANGDIKVTVGGSWTGVSAGVYGKAAPVSVDQAETNAETLRGYTVAAYVATDAISGRPYLKAIAPKTGKNEVIEIDYTALDAAMVNGTTGAIEAAKYFADPADYTSVELPLDPAFKSVYNNSGDKTSVDNITEVANFLTQKNVGGTEKVGKATLINNNMDDSYDYVFVSSYSSNDVVDAIDAVNGTINGKNGEVVDLGEKNSIWTFIKNGEIIDFEEIAVGNVLSKQEGKLGSYTIYTVYVCDTVVEGAVSEYRTTGTGAGVKDWYTIGTEEYHSIAGVNYKRAEGKFYLNVDNKIVYADVIRAGAGNYAVLLAAGINNAGLGSGAVELKFLTLEGEWKVAPVADRVSLKIGKADITTVDSAVVADNGTADLGIYTLTDADATASKVKAEAAAKGNVLFQYELNSAGKITTITTAYAGVADDDFSLDKTEASAIYKASTDRLGSVYLGENTKVFHIDTTKGALKEDRVTVASKALFSDGEVYNVAFYDMDLEGYPEVLVVTDANPGIDIATHPLVITKVVEGVNEAGYTVKKYYGFQAGEEVVAESVEGGTPTVTCKFVPGKAGVAPDFKITYTVEAGDVVLFGLDAKGAVETFELLMSAKDARATVAAADTAAGSIAGTFAVDAKVTNAAGVVKNAYNTFGYASKIQPNNRVVLNYVDGGALKYSSAILRGQDIHFYTVNINRGDMTAVNVGGFGDIAATNKLNKAGSWVFVREYDGNAVAVVIYTKDNAKDATANIDLNTGAFKTATEVVR